MCGALSSRDSLRCVRVRDVPNPHPVGCGAVVVSPTPSGRTYHGMFFRRDRDAPGPYALTRAPSSPLLPPSPIPVVANGSPGLGHRNLELYEEQRWLGDADADLAAYLDHGDGTNHERYWNMTAEAAAAAAAAASAYDDDGDFFSLHGAGGGLWAGDGAGDDTVGRPAGYGDAYGSGAAGFAPDEEWEADDARFAGEGEFFGHRDGAAAAVDPFRRGLKDLFPGVPWAEVWGEWGKEGERVFDETCYQRIERVMPVRGGDRCVWRSLFGWR